METPPARSTRPAPLPETGPRPPAARGVWLLAAAAVLGLSLVIGTVIAARTVAYVKTFDASRITVTGEAQQIVTSDTVVWRGGYQVNTYADALKGAYGQMAQDKADVLAFLTGHGVPASDVTFSPISMNQNYVDCKVNPRACGPFGSTSYTLTQQVTVQSSQVQSVTALAQDVSPLIREGVVFSTQDVEYYYSKLADQRATLVAQATRNAQLRAERIAEATGAHAGRLVSVTTEPLQLTPVNSTEVSNGGVYDTTTITKQLTAIVLASFRVT